MKDGVNYYAEIISIKNELLELNEKTQVYDPELNWEYIKSRKSELFVKLKEYNKQIQYTNSNITPVKPIEFDSDKIINKYKKITCILQYYDEPVIERRNELISAINNNINNKEINTCVIFLENTKSSRAIKSLKKDLIKSSKIKYISTEKRLTYQDAIKWVNKDNKKDTVYLLTNNDCYFNQSINLLKKVDYCNGKRLLCLTRKDQLKDGTIERGKSPPIYRETYEFNKVHDLNRENWSLLDYNCSDAWAFICSIDDLNCNYELGTFNCEYFFTEDLHLNNVQLRNPSEYIDCIHIHNTNFRRNYAFGNDITSQRQNKLYPSEPSDRNENNWILGTWRLRSKYNYVDSDSEMHEYSDYVVRNFMDICEGEE